ncbi:Endonuclease/exonuclease/phosphatase [Dichomitus squalens]|uniref:Endonuclease/exonuclease/phosphatase n=1 Tax=Dichomitus squalens TaxID=114155 RepID=A0A4V2JZX5_9APHY|nr:Endonuclease/exonuclease/phosphatase [Dichomitus squalens]
MVTEIAPAPPGGSAGATAGQPPEERGSRSDSGASGESGMGEAITAANDPNTAPQPNSNRVGTNVRINDDAASQHNPSFRAGDTEENTPNSVDTICDPRPNTLESNQLARKTTLRVATLNDHTNNKWGKIPQLMNEHRIGILMIQEAHLSAERLSSIEKLYERNLQIFNSAHPSAPSQKEGVAILVNKKLVNADGAQMTEVVKGRAVQLSLRCMGEDRIHVLCIYAPTSDGVEERRRFFREVQTFYEEHSAVPRPDVMAGDFNNVEDSIDRLPISDTPDMSVDDLDNLKISLGLMLVDGWRGTYPTTRGYTFHRGQKDTAVLSRLDRIYVREPVYNLAREWRILESGIKTDHLMVTVQLTTVNAPSAGRGRPIFPLSIIKDKKLTSTMKDSGMKAMNALLKIENGDTERSETTNPQTILADLKKGWMRAARDREKEIVPKLLAEIKELENKLESIKNVPEMDDKTRASELAAVSKKISDLEIRRRRLQQQNARAKFRKEGNRPTKYWCRLNKEHTPKNLIQAFAREGETTPEGEIVYETNPTKMAEMARKHHDQVQEDETSTKHPDERERDISRVLDSLEKKVSAEDASEIGAEVQFKECVEALWAAESGTAPGLDGIQQEVWKTLLERYIDDEKKERPSFNVIKLLKVAFIDIQANGVCPQTGFADGWMAPLYKKGEKSRVVNYRPITLLNTDYKLLTKILATRLSKVAPELVDNSMTIRNLYGW